MKPGSSAVPDKEGGVMYKRGVGLICIFILLECKGVFLCLVNYVKTQTVLLIFNVE